MSYFSFSKMLYQNRKLYFVSIFTLYFSYSCLLMRSQRHTHQQISWKNITAKCTLLIRKFLPLPWCFQIYSVYWFYRDYRDFQKNCKDNFKVVCCRLVQCGSSLKKKKKSKNVLPVILFPFKSFFQSLKFAQTVLFICIM